MLGTLRLKCNMLFNGRWYQKKVECINSTNDKANLFFLSLDLGKVIGIRNVTWLKGTHFFSVFAINVN